MGHVFISYSHKDGAYVDRLTAHLSAAGIEVWTDKGIEYGAEWVRTIDRQLRECAAFVPVMSRNSRQAEWVAKEILIALDLKKPTLPLLLDGDRFLELRNIQDEDVTGGRLPSAAYIARLQALTGTAPTAPPARPKSWLASQRQPAPTAPRPALGRSRPTAGRVVAWGNDSDGQGSVPAGLADVIVIAAGGAHNLALHRDGHVTAWGYNGHGQASVPARLTDVIAIAAGDGHNLALHRDGHITAWGLDSVGQARVPAGLTGVIAIAAGYGHNLALHRDGRVTAWGSNFYGEASVPARLTDVIAIAAGWIHSLALHRTGHVTAWGANPVGNPTGWADALLYGQASVPAGLTDVIAIAAGDFHNLALHRDGHITAWGDNRFGQATVPTGLTDVIAIAAGAFHNLALHRDGHVTAWGDNRDGQASVPAGPTNAIAAGTAHSLAIVND